jgi:hypothetical protein
MRILFNLLLVFVLGVYNLNAQNKEEYTSAELEDIFSRVQSIKPVESFKDSLLLKIDLTEIYIGKETKEIEFCHTEIITTESSLIKVNKDMALKISIARVIDNGNKCYLYKIHLFEKHKDSWIDKNANGDWSMGKLGTINYGYYIGTIGEDCFGYKGDITIN